MPRIRSLTGRIAGDRLPARIARLVVALLLAGSGTAHAQFAGTETTGTGPDTTAAEGTGDEGLLIPNIFGPTDDGASVPLSPFSGEVFTSTSAASIEQGQQALRTAADHVRRTGDGRGSVVAARMYSPDRAAAFINSGNIAQAQEAIHFVNVTSGGKSHLIRGKTVQETLIRSLEGPAGRSRTLDGWADGYGQKGNFDAIGNANVMSYGVGGTTFGAGYYLDDQTVVGILGGYSNSSVRGSGSEADQAKIDATQVGLYARAGFGDHYLLGVAARGNQDYATSRAAMISGSPAPMTAAYTADQTGILLEYGQNRQWGAFVAQPLVSIQSISLQTDRFAEQGAEGAALSVDGRTDDSLRASLGARFLMPLATTGERMLVPEIHGRYMHELRGGADALGATAAGTPLAIPGVNAGESFYLYGTGATYAVTPHMSLYGHYIGQATRQLVSHTGTSGVQLTW